MREVLGVTLVSVFLGILVPTTALFVLGGAGDQANLIKYFFYTVMLFASVIAIDFIRLFRSEGWFSQNPDYRAFGRMTAHSPQNTLLYQKLKDIEPIGKLVAETVKNPSKLFIVSYPIAVVFGLVIGVTGTFVSNVPQLFTQGSSISAGRSLLLAVEPAVISETLFWFVAFFYGVVGAVGFVLNGRANFDLAPSIIIGKVVSVLLTTISFTAFHLFRYSNSEADLIGVAFLGFISSVSVAVTDSIIPAYLLHASGNFFNKAKSLGLFANELIVIGVVAFLIVSVLAYILVIDPYKWIRGD